MVIFACDVTTHRIAVRKVLESERNYRALVENAVEDIVVINAQGNILFMNTVAARNHDGIPDDFIGKMVAHELAQPLTVLRLSLQNAFAQHETTPIPDSIVDDLHEGLLEVEKATRIMQRFRNFARTASPMHTESVQVGPLIERTIRLLDRGCQRAGLRVITEGLENLPAVQSCIRELEQLFCIHLPTA